MNRYFLTILIFVSTLSVSIGQIKATTNDGREVLLNDNGTWKYVEKSVPSKIINLDCSELTTVVTDKMTGKTRTSSKEAIIISDDGGKTGFGINLLNSEKSLIFSLVAAGAGNCIDDDDKMNVLFRDGTRLELFNDTEFNCDANFTLYFGGIFGKKRELEQFKTKEIETIRVWTSDGYVERDFSENQSKQLMKTISCLAGQLAN